MISRRHILRTFGTLPLTTAAHWANAQSGKTITVTVGFAPGGPGEVLGRRIADSMQKTLEQTVVVMNRPGAAGMLAAASLKGAPPDGSQLLFGPPGIVTTQPLVYKKLPYDPKQVEPLSGVCEFSFALAVKADHPATNLKQFVEWCKKNPGQASYGTVALGSVPHFVCYRLGREGGFEFQSVPYKGAKEIVNDMLGGTLPSGINVVSAFTAEHKAGTLRVLATTGSKRSKSLPDVPTFAEQGYPNIVAVESFGFFGPKGIPQQEADRHFDAIKKAVVSPEVQQFMAINDFEPAPRSRQDYQRVLSENTDRWAPIIHASGFKIE
jgi:tripartite-type tricarboxylate transporter receptor subunit TctC